MRTEVNVRHTPDNYDERNAEKNSANKRRTYVDIYFYCADPALFTGSLL